jgi:predicted Zn-dependent peptidase
MVMVGAGSRFETSKINGISHFLEHMAFKGTKKRPTAKDISQEVDAIGGEFNAFTSKDHTAYFIKAASDKLPLLLDILSDMMTNSLFKEEEIEREKGVICEEINMYEDTPMRKVAEVFENLMFGDSPMGWDIAGTAKIVRSLKRKDFVDYVDSLYKTSNMVVAIAGGFDGKVQSSKFKVQSLVEKYFGGLSDGKTLKAEKCLVKQDKPRLKIHFKKTEQAHLCLGFPAFSNTDQRRYAFSVLTTILGGGMSSRLFTEVRERRGLCYYVHASTDSYKDCGDFVVSAGVDLKRIDDAISTILNELWKFKVQSLKFKVTKEELRKAKEYIKGHTILGLEDSESVAGLYATQFILKDKIETPEEILERIEKVTMDEVYAVAKDIFNPKKVNLAVIGPFDDPSRFERLIK